MHHAIEGGALTKMLHAESEKIAEEKNFISGSLKIFINPSRTRISIFEVGRRIHPEATLAGVVFQ